MGLRSLSFPYEIVLGRPELLPLCTVDVLGPKGRARVRAVFDSGAEFPVFPRRAADDVGMPLPAAPNFPIQYGGSREYGRRVRAYIEIRQRRLDTEIIFVDRLAFAYALLGRRGIFGRFNEVAFLERVAAPRVELRW
jgi:hypothetical protein